MQISLKALMVTLLLTGLTLGVDGFPRSSDSHDVILEVSATDRDSYAGTQQTYLYIRVLAGQTVEWQTQSSTENKRLATFSRALTKREFNRIEQVIGDPEIGALKPRYELLYGVDSSTEWKISLPRRARVIETIQTANFLPGALKSLKRPLPNAFIKLGCTIQNLRNSVTGKGEDDLDDECKRVLRGLG